MWLVAVVWVVCAVDQVFGLRIVGSDTPALVLRWVGWSAAIVTAVVWVAARWKRSSRSVAVAATVVSLVCAAPIAVLEWKSLHARYFYLAHRSGFATFVREGVPHGDTAGGEPLPHELAYLSATGVVGAAFLHNDTAGRKVLFVPASRDRQVVGPHLDARRGGRCTAGYVYPQLEVSDLDSFTLCQIQLPVGDGWYWLG